MEPVAVNHVTITRELFAESHEAVFSVKRQKMLLYAGIIFVVTGLILLALQSRVPAVSALYIPLLLTGGIVIVWALTMKKSDLRKKYRAFQQKNGDNASRTITCDRTGLEIDTGSGKPLRIEYTDILNTQKHPTCISCCAADTPGCSLPGTALKRGAGMSSCVQSIKPGRMQK